MSCPYLKEVVMLYCQAYPVKKLVPLDRIASADPCLGHDYEACPLFKDVLTRIRATASLLARWRRRRRQPEGRYSDDDHPHPRAARLLLVGASELAAALSRA